MGFTLIPRLLLFPPHHPPTHTPTHTGIKIHGLSSCIAIVPETTAGIWNILVAAPTINSDGAPTTSNHLAIHTNGHFDVVASPCLQEQWAFDQCGVLDKFKSLAKSETHQGQLLATQELRQQLTLSGHHSVQQEQCFTHHARQFWKCAQHRILYRPSHKAQEEYREHTTLFAPPRHTKGSAPQEGGRVAGVFSDIEQFSTETDMELQIWATAKHVHVTADRTVHIHKDASVANAGAFSGQYPPNAVSESGVHILAKSKHWRNGRNMQTAIFSRTVDTPYDEQACNAVVSVPSYVASPLGISNLFHLLMGKFSE